MKVKILGIILAVIGILLMLNTGFNYITREKVIDLGRLEINREKNHTIYWTPIAGVVLLTGGILLIAATKNKA